MILLIFLNIFYFLPLKTEIFLQIYQESKNLTFFHSDIDKFIFVLSIIDVESSFRTNAVSKKGAVGLMQVMPYTADWLAKRHKIDKYNLYDAKDNLKLGILYLNFLWFMFRDINKVIMAYNMGHNSIKKGRINKKYLYKIIKKFIYYKENVYASNSFKQKKWQ